MWRAFWPSSEREIEQFLDDMNLARARAGARP
jgi:hypothetical protein